MKSQTSDNGNHIAIPYEKRRAPGCINIDDNRKGGDITANDNEHE
jgi:hypothetical protein